MARTLVGGRRDAKLGTTPSGKSIWLEKHPSEYKGFCVLFAREKLLRSPWPRNDSSGDT